MTVKDELQETLTEAKARLAQLEEAVALIPRLRREIRVLERSLSALDDDTDGRKARTGPSIREQIITAVRSRGTVRFDAGTMLPTIAGMVDAKKKSVQVELHRLIRTGELDCERDASGHPIALSVAEEAEVVAFPAEERRQG